MTSAKQFEANSNKRLGIILRVLADEGISDVFVKTILTEKGKIIFLITTDMDDEFYERLKSRYVYMRS